MRYKREFLVVAGFAVAVGFVVLIILATFSGTHDTFGGDSSSKPTESFAITPTLMQGQKPISSISDIPLYPTGHKIDEGCSSELQDQCYYRLLATGSLGIVTDFYSKAIMNSGWLLATTSYTDAQKSYLDFIRVDLVDNVSVRRYINVQVMGELGKQSEITVDVHFERWPDPTAIPIHKAGRQVEVSWKLDSVHNIRVIQYTVQASADDILAYYKAEMSKLGWVAGIDTDEIGVDGKWLPIFRYSRVSENIRMLGSYVRLYIEPNGSGQIVRLEAGGSDVEAEYDKHGH